MKPVEGARTFHRSGDAYDAFMGRYSRPLAPLFAGAAGVTAGARALDVGCGPGALTGELVARLGAEAVAAVDPSPPFVDACAARHPGVDVRAGSAESIPYPDGTFDVTLAQLVLHFVTDAPAAVAEMRRVTAAGGTVAVCVWDFKEGMQMLRLFWDAAMSLDSSAPDEARLLRYGAPGQIATLFAGAGLEAVEESTLEVASEYAGFDEFWAGFRAGIGPAGSHVNALPDDRRALLREELLRRLGEPAGAFTLTAVARCVTGRVP